MGIDSIVGVMRSSEAADFVRRLQEQRATVDAAFAFPVADSQGVNATKHAGVAHQHLDARDDDVRHMDVILTMVGGHERRSSLWRDVSLNTSDAQYRFVHADRYLHSHRITYRVQGGQKRRVGGGWHDPFARALSNALQRSALGQPK